VTPDISESAAVWQPSQIRRWQKFRWRDAEKSGVRARAVAQHRRVDCERGRIPQRMWRPHNRLLLRLSA